MPTAALRSDDSSPLRKAASGASFPYVIHSDGECERLEFQAKLANIEGHLRHIPIAPTDCVLDVGCGSGSMTRLIGHSFPRAKVIGVDVRDQYLDFAEARARDEDLHNVGFRRADVFELPFPDGTFNVVWAKYLLQWLKEPKAALAEFKRVTKPGGVVVSCDYSGFATEHFPIDFDLERQLRQLIAASVDSDIGRKVAPFMIALGFRDVQVQIEADTLFTVIGTIDADRRQNWETQLQAMRPHLIALLGSELSTDRFVKRFLDHYDDPTTCSYTSLYFTRGRV